MGSYTYCPYIYRVKESFTNFCWRWSTHQHLTHNQYLYEPPEFRSKHRFGPGWYSTD
ncbi:MAG: hypothetical protein JWP57_2211 [Spirosoma sp.]|nr:hypothetical protein [Spirosoma sp.]